MTWAAPKAERAGLLPPQSQTEGLWTRSMGDAGVALPVVAVLGQLTWIV